MTVKTGVVQMKGPTGGDTAPGGAYILTELHGITCVGISAGVDGVTAYNVQVAKIAWGSSGEYYWVGDEVAGSGTTGCGSAPLPCQLLDSNGIPIKSTVISGSSKSAVDVFLRGQGGSASQIEIIGATDQLGGTSGWLAVAGTSAGGYLKVAGSTDGGAIPHIGGTTDVLGSLTFGVGSVTLGMGGTGAFSGTISAKLRTISSDIHSILAGGTGSDGISRISGISADIRSAPTLNVQYAAGATIDSQITSIAGGLTVGIGSVSIDNPVVIGHRSAGYTFEQVKSVSTTLQSGVRLKNVNGSGTLTVTYDTLAGSTTGMTSGFQLDDREELFVEVDNLTKVYVMAGATAGCTFSYYAT
jgi:hypothetical protein